MVNEERVRLMTELADYEEHSGKKDLAVGRYFRSDFMGLQMLKSLIYGTLSFGILAAFYMLYHFETFMQEVYRTDLLSYAKRFLWIYLAFLGAYLIITYVVYAYRYYKARMHMKEYMNKLRRLERSYEE